MIRIFFFLIVSVWGFDSYSFWLPIGSKPAGGTRLEERYISYKTFGRKTNSNPAKNNQKAKKPKKNPFEQRGGVAPYLTLPTRLDSFALMAFTSMLQLSVPGFIHVPRLPTPRI